MPARPAALALLAVAIAAAGVAGPPATNATEASVVGVYPNPAADGDTGEFVLLDIPPDSRLGAYSLTDGEGVARPANRTAGGTVALSTAPGRVRALTDYRVVALRGDLALANGGDRVTLRRRGVAVDSLAYRDAPAGEIYRRRAWRPLGATDFAATAVENATVRTFALPDAPGVPAAVLRSADRRLLLAGYTFRSRRAAALLADAAARGVEVRVLVEGGPAGGVGRREARLLDRLAGAGVEVRVVDGPLARYRFHHPKYAVADGRALVTSENWAAGGTGGRGTRGWGVVVADPELADRLAAVFRADAGWRDAVPWRVYRRNATFQPATPPANDSYPARFPARTHRARSVRLVVAPDNAERTVAGLLASAEERLLVAQPRVDPNQTFVREAVAAARRGVTVRILLGSAWYERAENRRTARYLRAIARREELDLAVRLVDPRSRFDRLHVKGVVVDGEAALVGSLNWNNVSARENREVALLVRGPPAGYYARVFRADWRGGAWRLPLGALAVGLAAIGAAAVGVARAVRFTAERRRPARNRGPPDRPSR